MILFWIFLILIVGGFGVAVACIDTRGPSAPILPPRPRVQQQARPSRRSARAVPIGVVGNPLANPPVRGVAAASYVHVSSFDPYDNPSDHSHFDSSSFDGGGSFGGFDGGCGGGDCGGGGD